MRHIRILRRRFRHRDPGVMWERRIVWKFCMISDRMTVRYKIMTA